jgi:hypothetical protein
VTEARWLAAAYTAAFWLSWGLLETWQRIYLLTVSVFLLAGLVAEWHGRRTRGQR